MELTTAEEQDEWAEYLKTNPERVFAALSILDPRSRPNKWGDTHAALFHAMAALAWIGVSGTEWQRLARDGIVNILCQQAIKLTSYTETFPSLRQDMSEDEFNALPAPWFYPLSLVTIAACGIQDHPTAEDVLLIAALKRNWFKIMERIWECPGNSLDSGPQADSHVSERALPSQLLCALTCSNPSFWIIASECPFTFSVIVRNFVHATKSARPEYEIVGKTSLKYIIAPFLPKEFADYRDTHPPHASTLERILRGADGTVEKLIFKFEWYLGWLDITNAVHCVETLILIQVFLGSRPDPLFMEEHQRLLQSEAYWKIRLTFLKRAANHWDLSDESHRSIDDPISARILINTAHSLSEAYHYTITQRESLLRALMNADRFGLLDDVLPIYAKRHPPTYAPQALLLIFQTLGLLSRENPSLAAILRPHLPRPKSMAALLVAAFFKNGQIVATPSPPRDEDVEGPSDYHSIHKNFRFFAQLEEACRLETECGRRGCSNEMRARCSVCHTMAYWGPECQKSNWPEHKLTCEYAWVPVAPGSNKLRVRLPRSLTKNVFQYR